MKNYKMYIGGEWVESVSGESFETKNPYTGETWATLPRGNADDANRAVAAAQRAFEAGEWASMTASQRGQAPAPPG